MTDILESYQNCLYVLANEENALGVFLRECSKIDKTKAGKVMAITGKRLTQSSHQRIRLYMPLVRLFQEMETFHTRAVSDTSDTVAKLENKRSKYRASLLWMKDISEKLNPDVYRELDKFRKVQNQVRIDKKAFDSMQMDVVQKIDLLMASRCNLMNQILAPYQSVLLETFEKNEKNFEVAEALIKKEDIHEYEFKTLKQLNPLPITDDLMPTNDNPIEDLFGTPPASDLAGTSNQEENLLGDFMMQPQLDDDSKRSNEVSKKAEESGPKPMLIADLFDKGDRESRREAAIDLLMNLEDSEQKSDVDLIANDLETGDKEESVQGQPSIDLLTDELEEIDNSSYFKSLQSQIHL